MTKIAYFFIFLITFIAVTGAIYFLDQKYNNIFALDFSPAPNAKQVNTELKARVDSLNTFYKVTQVDTFFIYQDTTLIYKLDSANSVVSNLTNQLREKDQQLKEKSDAITNLNQRTVAVKDSAKAEWLKATVKLYETMDAKVAARIIIKYPEDLAKEIIYSLKKKKAGEILSQLDAETVSKYTGAN